MVCIVYLSISQIWLTTKAVWVHIIQDVIPPSPAVTPSVAMDSVSMGDNFLNRMVGAIAAISSPTVQPMSSDGVWSRSFVTAKYGPEKAITIRDVDNKNDIVSNTSQRPQQGRKVPCHPPGKDWKLSTAHRRPTKYGFFYLKEMKVGGSTAAGVHLRIARMEAIRQGLAPEHPTCRVRNSHTRAGALKYGMRDKERSFIWTLLRDPTTRAISQFFHFEVSRNKVEPTDKAFINWIREYKHLDNYYLNSLSTSDNVSFVKNFPITAANEIMQEYDFIGITERMDESIVALQLLLDVKRGMFYI